MNIDSDTKRNYFVKGITLKRNSSLQKQLLLSLEC